MHSKRIIIWSPMPNEHLVLYSGGGVTFWRWKGNECHWGNIIFPSNENYQRIFLKRTLMNLGSTLYYCLCFEARSSLSRTHLPVILAWLGLVRRWIITIQFFTKVMWNSAFKLYTRNYRIFIASCTSLDIKRCSQ